MKKIGIMGGTFNPIHNGHLMLAERSYRQYVLDQVLVIPNKLPAYKDTDELLDARQRSEMVKLAIQPYSYMQYSDMELRRQGITHTVDTLMELNRQYPDDQFYFILGADSLVHFEEWYQYREILKLAVILCAGRDGLECEKLDPIREKLLSQVPEARIAYLDTPMMEISSTDIRERIAQKEWVMNRIPKPVYQYIMENHLYMA